MNGFHAFWSKDNRSFSHLNQAYMILLKKKAQPAEIRDYRPISLIHSFGKLVTKCLAKRLSKLLDGLVQCNQSAFIKGRRIHDNFRSVKNTCMELHKRKDPAIMLKIDIAKAFDTVSWSFLLEILAHMGFGRRWRNWISTLLSTASTKILLNGQPGRRICHARGLRQGDPLSPMLFVITMEVLNRTLLWIDHQHLLTTLHVNVGSRVSLYADDLVLFILPTPTDMEAVKATLAIFGLASGLFSNLDKSVAVPLHCTEHDISLVTEHLSCRIEDFPCRYLGVPLVIHRLRRSDEQPVIDKVAGSIPRWKGDMLNIAGRTALVRATLSAIPVHMAITLCLSSWAIEAIDRIRRGFIWRGVDKAAKGKCRIAWETVCRPRDLGGLGVSDLRRAGIALRVRWEFQARAERRTELMSTENAVVAVFQAATIFQLGDGRSVFFWTDNWLGGISPMLIAPTVFASVGPRKRKTTVAEALNGNAWFRHFTGAPTMQALLEIAKLCDLVDEVQLTSEPDTFLWRLMPDRCYSAASTYNAMFLGSSASLGAKYIWKTSAPPRVKFFFWLVMHDPCWTGDRRFCHGLQKTNTCIMCDQEPETMDHILIGCCFSRIVWDFWTVKLHLQSVLQMQGMRAIECWLLNRKLLPKTIRRGFDSLFFLAGWMIWKERNVRTFDGVASNPLRLCSRISEEVEAWCSAGYRHLSSLMAIV